jgi:hypothetical protein
MQLPQPLLESGRLRPCRFDDELLFAIRLDAPLPPINRRHHGEDIDARGEPLLHQDSAERGGIGVGAERGQDDHGAEIVVRSRIFLCTRDQNALL